MSEQERAMFDEMHRQHFDTLVHWCLSYVSYNSELRNDAEDWAQEAFKRAVKYKEKFFSSENQLAWLITACKHIAGNALQRKAVRDKRHGSSLDGPSKPSVEDLQTGFDIWAAKEEAKDTVGQIVALLTQDEYKVYEEYFLEDLSEKEVSDKIGKSVSAVKATIRRIRNKAKNVSEREGS